MAMSRFRIIYQQLINILPFQPYLSYIQALGLIQNLPSTIIYQLMVTYFRQCNHIIQNVVYYYNNELIFQICMYAQRTNIDLDSMIDKVSTLSKPRAPTPIRKAPIKIAGNKQNMINPGNQWGSNQLKINTNFDDKQLLMPELNIKKPLISPVRNPFKTQIDNMYEEGKRNLMPTRPQRCPPSVPNCANHPNKPAQFNIDIQDQCFAYCSRCAAQLASQGFEVRKIQPQTVKKGDSQRQASDACLPMYPQYQGNPMYQLILDFLTQLTQAQNDHLKNMQRLSQIEQNYQTQIENTKYFYKELIEFIEQMRDDHIEDLIEQNRRHSQIADIEHDYLRENAEEINNIRKDIEQNLETILEKLTEDDLKNNLNYYKQKLQVFQHKVEEQQEFFAKIISFKNQQYQDKLTKVQDFLMDVWNTDAANQTQQQPQMQNCLKNQPYHQNQNYFQAQNYPQSQPYAQPQTYCQPQPYAQPQTYSQGQTYSQQQKSMTQGQQNRQAMPSSNQNMSRQVPQQQLQQIPQTTQQIGNGVGNMGKRGSNPLQGQMGEEGKTTAFRKLFEEDEDQVMAQTSPQFKKI